MSKIIEIALREYGIKEVKGEKHNERVLEYFHEIGYEWVVDDETAWCSAFANWVCLMAGHERSKALNARSWLNVGLKVETPMLGDVVIFWRESKKSWKGHVAFYINHDVNNIYVLGGNQGNQVCIKPYAKDRLLGYRRLI